MAKIYHIVNGQTQTEIMSYEEEGAIVRLFFFDGAGAQVTPTGAAPQVFRENGLLWLPVNKFSANEWAFNGPCKQVQISLAGVTGYTTYRAEVWRANEPIDLTPDGLYSGLRAITVQPYTEANVKNGRQFYVRAAWPGQGPAADPIITGEANARRLWFKTGSEPVIVKLRELSYIAELLRVRLFVGPTGVTGGTDLTLHNYNGVAPYLPAVPPVAKKNVNVTTLGTEFDGGDPEYVYGAATSGNRTQGSIPQGRERILPANTEFIVEITNLSSGGGSAAQVQYFLDFYIGGSDLPLP